MKKIRLKKNESKQTNISYNSNKWEIELNYPVAPPPIASGEDIFSICDLKKLKK